MLPLSRISLHILLHRLPLLYTLLLLLSAEVDSDEERTRYENTENDCERRRSAVGDELGGELRHEAAGLVRRVGGDWRKDGRGDGESRCGYYCRW